MNYAKYSVSQVPLSLVKSQASLVTPIIIKYLPLLHLTVRTVHLFTSATNDKNVIVKRANLNRWPGKLVGPKFKLAWSGLISYSSTMSSQAQVKPLQVKPKRLGSPLVESTGLVKGA